MFGYYLKLGWHSLGRNPVLTALMVLGIALGISASMTTLTVLYLLGSDPIPSKSDRLYAVEVDNWDADDSVANFGDPGTSMTYGDATALSAGNKADKQATMFEIRLPLQPRDPRIKPFSSNGRATGADFFSLFDTPFRYGTAWAPTQDARHERVVVLNETSNERLFGGENSVGKTLFIDGVDYSVIGVLSAWRPRIKFYDLSAGKLSGPEDFYIPFSTAIDLKIGSKNYGCPNYASEGTDWNSFLASECTWVQLWVELDSPLRATEYRAYIDRYVGEQKKLGRFPRPLNNRLFNVGQLMKSEHVIPTDVKIEFGLSLAFLVVCLLNTVGLLLAKFIRKSGEIGVRRALGASRAQIFAQHLIEAGVVGAGGGILGLLLTTTGLWVVRMLYTDYGPVAELDPRMVVATIAASIGATLIAALYPTWRACRIEPALQIKMQ